MPYDLFILGCRKIIFLSRCPLRLIPAYSKMKQLNRPQFNIRRHLPEPLNGMQAERLKKSMQTIFVKIWIYIMASFQYFI